MWQNSYLSFQICFYFISSSKVSLTSQVELSTFLLVNGGELKIIQLYY